MARASVITGMWSLTILDHVVEAPLKPLDRRARRQLDSHPRPRGRGPVEGRSATPEVRGRCGHPRPRGRGPVEGTMRRLAAALLLSILDHVVEAPLKVPVRRCLDER